MNLNTRSSGERRRARAPSGPPKAVNSPSATPWKRCGALLAPAVIALACATPTNEGLNTQLPVLERSVDQLLAEDDIAAAEGIARGLERRLPGIDTYGLLGRVLWRAGDLMEAEALWRRAAAGGIPEGMLGMARSRFARGERVEAAAIAGELTSVEEVAVRARRLLAAVAVAEGDLREAAEQLATAAEAEENPRRARDLAEAEALREIAAGERGVGWSGSPAVLDLHVSDMTVAGFVDGVAARIQISLMDDRTAVPADGSRAEEAPPVRVTEIGLGDLSARVPAEVRELPEGVGARIGFDALSRLSWVLDLRGGTLALARDPGRGLRDQAPEPSLPRTYWAAVRVVRDGLAVQLLLLPRVRGEVMSTGLDPGGRSRIDGRALSGPVLRRDDGPVDAEVRLGAWRETLPWEIVDLYVEAEDGAVAPQAVLGGPGLEGWRLYWRPNATSLALERQAEDPGLQ